MSAAQDPQLLEAQEAFARNDWPAAVQGYESIDGLATEDMERYGYAILLGGGDSNYLEGAVDQYEREARPQDAARVALEIARFSAGRGQFPLAMGWVRRAARMLEDEDEGGGHAHLIIHKAFMAYIEGRLAESLELTERAHAMARAHGDRDAEAFALNRRGRVLLRMGRVAEGQADLDEAMLLVRRGLLRATAAAVIYCSTIDACTDIGDFERALQWTEAAAAWTEDRKVCAFPGICWVHRAELQRLRGDLDGARSQVDAAFELFERLGYRTDSAIAKTELGMQLLEAGDLDGARLAFEVADEIGLSPTLGFAKLHLCRGDASKARALLEPAVEGAAEDPLVRAKMQPTYIEACLALGDDQAADTALADLAKTADSFGTVGLRASLSSAAARLHLFRGEAAKAVHAARDASREWAAVGAIPELNRAKELVQAAYEMANQSARGRIERALIDELARTIAAVGTLEAKEAFANTAQLADGVPEPLRDSQRISEGTVLGGKIVVGRLVGAGGMGVVYAGRHKLTGRDVAIKVLHRVLCHNDSACARFLQEALACGRIKHPNVVDIYDAGEQGNEPYIVMELLAGETLSELLERTPQLSVPRALQIAEHAARGVAAAHAAAVVHRDLKPGNIFLCGDCEAESAVKVLDFGLSKLPNASQSRADALIGTPLYMAPEQVRKSSVIDARTDVYALGATLFEMLTGRPPFLADDLPGVLAAIADGDHVSVRELRPEIASDLEAVVHRAIAHDPDHRFGSAEELGDALGALRRALE